MASSRAPAFVLACVAGGVFGAVACGDNASDLWSAQPHTAGAGGGSAGKAGNSSGGASTVAGSGGTLGTSGSGGVVGTSGTGGSQATAGTGAGGAANAGGSSAASSGSGGGTQAGTGGTGTGAAGSGGSAGTESQAGTTGANGGGAGAPTSDTGCGASSWPEEGEHTIDVDGVERAFVLSIPTSYDSEQRYPVVFSWHGLGGTMGGFYQLDHSSRAGDAAILVSPQGLDNEDEDGAGWWNTDDRDLALVDALLDWTEQNFCIDESRRFSVGFSFGGMFSHLIGCERGAQFAAIAPIAGSFYNYYGFRDEPSCAVPVPVWSAHGREDESVTIEDGRDARDVWLDVNGCSQESESVEPSPCVAYQGCESGYPVHWCAHDGEHTVPNFAADAIWDFFQQF